MKNAFFILGATPEDNADKLRELFEEKQLFFDDDSEINYAYTELTNLKKRIKHEIRYFTAETFKNFNDIFFDNSDDEQEMVIEDMCSSIIEVGKWFDLGTENLFLQINDNRKIAKFAPIGNIELVQNATDELKSECILGIKKYFDYLKEKDIVFLFNTLVEQENYMSFFIDDLLAIYEDMMKESIDKKEKACLKKFELIETDANTFVNDDVLSFDFATKITEFKKSLTAWDKIVQPLQVNFSNRGAQHELSVTFATSIRNKVIDMCNKSQESLTKLINYELQYSSAKQNFVDKAVYSIEFIDHLIKILDVLCGAFSEIDVFTERLKKDKVDFSKLKEELTKMLNQIDPYHTYRNKTNRRIEKQQSQSYSSGSSTFSRTPNRTSSSSQSDETWKKAIRWIVGITIVLSLIGTIISFSSDGGSTAIGVISLIICIITCVCAYKWGQLDIKLDTMKVVSIVLAVVMGIVCIVSASISSSNSDGGYTPSGTSYTVTFNKQGGSGGTYSVEAYYDDDMPYATKPSKSGYEFLGYYSSTNGNGTKYYDKYMNSVRKWDKKYDTTLYAYWDKDGITLTSSNFEDYFTLTSSCSVSGSSSYRTATYSYSISPKSSFHYSYYSDNPSSISVTIGLDISSISTSYGTPSEYKIYVTLYKSSGYKTSGSRSYSISSYEQYWDDGIYSVSGTIYN